MGDRPYTDEDLRAEAASQHHALTEDPDYMGIGEAMDDDIVASTGADGGGKTWGELLPSHGDFGDAQDAIGDLISKAADVSDWAVNLGADGLEPEEHQFTFKADEKPIIRVHFAFAPELSDEARTAFVEGLGAAAAREMQLALDGQ